MAIGPDATWRICIPHGNLHRIRVCRQAAIRLQWGWRSSWRGTLPAGQYDRIRAGELRAEALRVAGLQRCPLVCNHGSKPWDRLLRGCRQMCWRCGAAHAARTAHTACSAYITHARASLVCRHCVPCTCCCVPLCTYPTQLHTQLMTLLSCDAQHHSAVTLNITHPPADSLHQATAV